MSDIEHKAPKAEKELERKVEMLNKKIDALQEKHGMKELSRLNGEREEYLDELEEIRTNLRIVHRGDPQVHFELSRPLNGDLFIPLLVGLPKEGRHLSKFVPLMCTSTFAYGVWDSFTVTFTLDSIVMFGGLATFIWFWFSVHRVFKKRIKQEPTI